MKYNLLILVSLLFIGLSSCDRNELDEDLLKGKWVEMNSRNQNPIYIEFTTSGIMYLDRPEENMDTVLYTLDKDKQVLKLDYQNGYTGEMKIMYNKKQDLITLFGMYISIPEQTTQTDFERQ